MEVEEIVPERHLAVSLLDGARASGGMLACESCPYVTPRFARMQRHLQWHREKKKSTKVECEVCGCVLSCKLALMRHLRLHNGNLFKCEVCGKAYNQSPYLKAHILHKHSGKPVEKRDKTFECGTCGVMFVSKGNLVAHTKRHTDGKKFRCEFCDKKFYIKSELKEHLRVHTGERPFVCDRCGFGCTQQSNLRTHIKSCAKKPIRAPQEQAVPTRKSSRLSSSTYSRTVYDSFTA